MQRYAGLLAVVVVVIVAVFNQLIIVKIEPLYYRAQFKWETQALATFVQLRKKLKSNFIIFLKYIQTVK